MKKPIRTKLALAVSTLTLAFLGACTKDNPNPNNGSNTIGVNDNASTSSAATTSTGAAPGVQDNRPMPGPRSPTGAGVDPTDSRDNAKSLQGYGAAHDAGVFSNGGRNPSAANSPQASAVNPSAFQAATSINLNAYPYDRRAQLRSVLETRMTAIDRGIDGLRAQINSKPNNGGRIMQERLTDVAQKYDGADERLEGLEAVRPENWNNYKRQLRDEIASLEQAFQQLQVATK